MVRRRRWRGLVLGVAALVAGALSLGPALASPPSVAGGLAAVAAPAGDSPESAVARGERLFSAQLTPADGLGPLFNGTSCASCHSVPAAGGTGPDGLGVAIRVGRMDGERFDPLEGSGGPVTRRHSVAELGHACGLLPGIPPGATVTSVRNASTLFGLGLLDAIPDAVILAGAVPKADGVHGRPHLIDSPPGEPRVGRFGWKADAATLERFVADAFRNEHGITSPLAPEDLLPATLPPGSEACPGLSEGLESDGTMMRDVTRFIAALPPPAPSPAADASLVARGAALFRSTGCIACHTPSLSGPAGDVPLYSDLLLHDLGPVLDDGVVQGTAGGREWRTAPLWGLGTRTRYLHDGRARTLRAAILAHGGAASPATARFRDLPAAERDALLAFLGSL